MTDDPRISMKPRVRLPRYWKFFEAIEEANAGDTAKLRALIADESWNPTPEQRASLNDLLFRKLHHDANKPGPKGDRIRKGNKEHAEETIYARALKDIKALRAELPGGVPAATKKRIAIKHKARLHYDGHPAARRLNLTVVLNRLKRSD